MTRSPLHRPVCAPLRAVSWIVVLVAVSVLNVPAWASRLDDVRARGTVRCGVLNGAPGQSVLNDRGIWVGFDIDYCKALGAAVFGDATKITIRPASLGQLMAELKSGEVDVLAVQMSYTISRETELGLRFIGPTIFTGYTFLVPQKLHVTSFKDLDGATICTETGSASEEKVGEYFRENNLQIKLLSIASSQQMYGLYDSGRCDAVTGERTALSGRLRERKEPAEHQLVQGVYAKAYQSAAVRGDDEDWVNLTRWTHFAIVRAEELRITQSNVDSLKASPSSDVRRFLGIDGQVGSRMGLARDWAAAIIRTVGNYAEVWDRNMGTGSVLQLSRDQNRLVDDGGLMFSPAWQ